MALDFTKQTINSGFESTDSLEENFSNLETALQDGLSRTGNTPNEMEADLDMNSNRILNLPAPVNDNEAVRWVDVKDGVTGIDEPVPSQSGNSSKFLSTNGSSLVFKDVMSDIDLFTNSAGTGVARTLQERMDDWISVKDYGAVGDGSTDDRTAIQAAIDAAEAAGGGVVYFPAGVYIISDYIKVDAPGVMLQGVGGYIGDVFGDAEDITLYGSVIKLEDNATLTEHPNNSGDYPIVWLQYGSGLTDSGARWGGGVRDLVIFGNRRATGVANPTDASATNNNSNGTGLYLEGFRNGTFENIVIGWCADNGLHTVTGTVGVTANFGNSHFSNIHTLSNVKSGMRFSGGDTRFDSLNSGYNGAQGVYFIGGKIADNVLAWNNFEDGILIDGGNDDFMLRAYSYDNQHAGIKLGSGTFDRLMIDAICQDNGQDTGLTDQERSGIYIVGTVSGFIRAVCNNKQKTGTTGQKYGCYILSTDSIVDVKISEGAGTANGTNLLVNSSWSTELTISSGEITVADTNSIAHHDVDTESDASSDDLDTINGGFNGQLLILRAEDSARTVVCKDNTGNLQLNGDFSLTNNQDTIMLMKVGSNWVELSRSDNTA